jgi:adenosine deaminase
LPQLTARHAYLLAKNSFQASFVSEAQKTQWTLALQEAFVAAS